MEEGRDVSEQTVAPPRWKVAAETAVLTAAVPALGLALTPQDPFFLGARFPWLELAPLLVGLRHGAAPGILAAGLLSLGVLLAGGPRATPIDDFPVHHGLALLVAGLLAGEFADLWSRRQRRLTTLIDYHRARLRAFSRSFQVLKASHDMLQQEVSANPQSLRDVLAALRAQLGPGAGGELPLVGPAGEGILALFSEFGRIQMATLFPVDAQGELRVEAAARLGEGFRVDPSDPMIDEALRTRRLVSVGAEFRGREQETVLLAAVPIVDVSERVWAVVAVEEMLFTALQAETLNLLAVLAGRVGDLLASTGDDTSDRNQLRLEIKRAVADARDHGLPTSLVRISGDDPQRLRALFAFLVEHRRGVDRAFMIEEAGAPLVIMLLPLTDEAGLNGFAIRLEALLRERLGGSSQELGLAVASRVLRLSQDPAEVLPSLGREVAA
jgi:hypothetical protein